MATDNSITRPARRSFLGLLTGAAVAPAAIAPPTPAKADTVESTAAALAAAMARLHGGRWTSRVDDEAGFILIQQRGGRA